MVSNENKNKIYNILYKNSIKYIYNLLKSDINNDFNDISKILYIISNTRYKIELLLSKLFPTLDLDINLSKFGRARSKLGTHGKKYINKEIKKQYYIPFEFLIKNEYQEVLYTPIYIKYKHYDNKIKSLCMDNLYMYKNNNITFLDINEPVFKLLHKYENLGFCITYKNIELSAFYYELNDNLYNELKNIPIGNRFLSTDINLYRAIYHTNPKSHKDILEIINIKYLQIIKNINDPIYNLNSNLYNKNLVLIKEIYWFLSHATLYERGSCAITEIFCNSLLILINKRNEISKIFVNKENINTDIEAMITSDPNNFVKLFDSFINYINIDNINEFSDISRYNDL